MKPLILSSPFDVDELTEGRETLITEMRQILQDAQSDSRELTAQERKAFAAASRDFEKFGDQLKAAQEREAEAAALDKAGRTRKPQSRILGDAMQMLYAGPAHPRRGFSYLSADAVVIDPVIQPEFIASLQTNNPVYELGARSLTGPNFQQFARQAAKPTIHWFEEITGAVLPDSTAAIDALKIEYRVPAVLFRANNFWLQDSGGLGAEVLSRMGVAALQEAVITAVLSGAAASGQPVGLDNVSGVQTVAAGGALTTYAKINEAIKKLLAANVRLENIGGIMSPRVWQMIANMQDSTGQPINPPKALLDMPMHTSTAVLENYGVGNDETRVYLGDFTNCFIASSAGPQIAILRETRATNFETEFLIHMRLDVGFARPNAFCRIEGIPVA